MSSVDFRMSYQMIPPARAKTIRTSSAMMPKYVGHTDFEAVFDLED
jgi:hypothetical protein